MRVLGMLRLVHWAGWLCWVGCTLVFENTPNRCLVADCTGPWVWLSSPSQQPSALLTRLLPLPCPALYGTRSAFRRFPLPFAVHLPLHLLCLWVLTASTTLAHTRSGSATSAGGALLAQLLLGFLLSTCLVYRREAELRARFLNSRRAAACLAASGSRQKRPPQAPVPAN